MRIEAVGGTSLVVAGGGGRFTAATQGGRDSSFPAASLIDRARGDAEEVVMVGGCETSLPARYILLDVEKVRRAAVSIFERGCLDPSLEWEPL